MCFDVSVISICVIINQVPAASSTFILRLCTLVFWICFSSAQIPKASFGVDGARFVSATWIVVPKNVKNQWMISLAMHGLFI